MLARIVTGNVLLDALPEEAWERVAASLKSVDLRAGQVLHVAGAPRGDVYFPAGAIVSKLYLMENGASAEIALIGREGMVGVALFLGGQALLGQARVQTAGAAFRMPALQLKQEFDCGGALMDALLRHIHSLMAHIIQTAACNRHATLEQRLCRWLLLTLDRSPGVELAMTHESIGDLLGVRREGVTEVAGRLQQQGLIRYHRGHITVLDRPALERRASEFYTLAGHHAQSGRRSGDAQ